MVASLMLHPLRLTTAGQIACAPQGSDPYLESQVRVVIETHIGERDMVMPFGVPDPTFARLAVSDVQTCLDRYGPDGVVITSLTRTPAGDTEDDYAVTWRRVSVT